MITVDIPAALRQMIDARLDNIERALMTQGMARGDRRQVLSAIEDQILEMLGQSAEDEPTRDDVLGVLARLDPPEAYLDLEITEPTHFERSQPTHHFTDARAMRSASPNNNFNPLAVISLLLTGLAFLGSFTWLYLEWFGLIPLAAVTLGASICGTIALCQFQSATKGRQGLWMAVTATSCAPTIAFLSWISAWSVG